MNQLPVLKAPGLYYSTHSFLANRYLFLWTLAGRWW